MKRIVVFASGTGSNFENIVTELHQKQCEVALLICDKQGAYCLERAVKLGIKYLVIEPSTFVSKSLYEQKILEELVEIKPDLIVLAGYMRLIGPDLLTAYEGKIINIHPSLLPAFPGRDGIGDALAYGVKIMGITVHYVDAGIDTGQIIDQLSFKRMGKDSKEEITAKIHELEKELYPQVIKRLLSEEC